MRSLCTCQCCYDILKQMSFGKMFVLLIFFVLSFSYVDQVQGVKNEDNIRSTIIARENLYLDDVLEFSLKLQITEEMKLPCVMISFMIDKTLGYEFDPFFPYLTDKIPVLDLNVAIPSTAIYEIDFITKTLNPISSSSVVNLYPNIDNIPQKMCGLNRSEETVKDTNKESIKVTQSHRDKNIFYDLNFVLYVDSTKSEGLYKIHLHSYDDDVLLKAIVRFADMGKYLKTFLPIKISLNCFEMLLHCRIIAGLMLNFKWSVIRSNQHIFQFSCYFYMIIKYITIVEFTWHLVYAKVESMASYGFIETIIFISIPLFLFIIMLWFKDCINNLYDFVNYKMVKYHIFFWLMMVHMIVQNYHYIFLSNLIKILQNLVVIGMMTVYMYDITLTVTRRSWNYQRTTDENGNDNVEFDLQTNQWYMWKRYWYCIVIYAFIVSFNLILAVMIFFEVPFHLYWIEVIVDDVSSFMLWQVVAFKNQIHNDSGNIIHRDFDVDDVDDYTDDSERDYSDVLGKFQFIVNPLFLALCFEGIFACTFIWFFLPVHYLVWFWKFW